MSLIVAGAGSWNAPALIRSGRFYPHEIKSPLARLRYYAERLPLAELDGAFHLLPTVRDTLGLCGYTPHSFTFDVPAFRLLTEYPTGLGALPNDIRDALGETATEQVRYADLPGELREELWQRFFLGIEPLRRANKLGAIVLRFPLSFVPSAANFNRLAQYADRLKGHTVALVFGHRAWADEDRLDRVLEFERRHGFVHVISDEPDRPENAFGSRWTATHSQLAIVRAHGPKRTVREAGNAPAPGENPAFRYSEEELRALAGRTRRLAEQVAKVHVIFCNDLADCAHTNAAQFALILSWMDG